MKRTFLFFLTLWFSSFALNAQVVINEVLPGGTVELKNLGTSTVDISEYWLCDFPSYDQIQDLNIICGNMMLGAGEILAIDNFNVVDANDGEMGLYLTSNFGSSTSIIDYVEWGSTGHTRSSVAVAAGIWTTGDFVPAFGANESLEYDGSGEASGDWNAQSAPSVCEENSDPPSTCDVSGGTLDGGPFEFCVGDGVEDNVSGISLNGNSGMNSQWVVTDEQGNILGLPPMPSAVNFDGAGPGTCLIWHLSYDDGLSGLEVQMNTNNLDGCFEFSNAIAVVRNQPEGGTLEGGPFEFCVGDGEDDNVSGITLTGNSGTNSQWVVTDDQGNILGLPPMPSVVNFDGAGPGTCLIWHLSFEDGLQGAEVGMNANDLVGCYSLSNPITVVRNQPEGGVLQGGPFEFCVGDGVDDNVSGISLSGNSGTNSQWVVTDDQGNILGLPPMPSAVNFDGAGPGTCLIWHLSFEDGLQGAEVGLNAGDLAGCYSLSNPITVVRNQPEGGTLEGGPFEFCVGDGIADNVSGITLSGNSGSNSQWVVTDDQGNILGLPPMPSVVNFDGAGAGTCLIWHLSFEDGLEGAEVGLNAGDLIGCYSLSNPITVVRNQPDGGILEGGRYEFCVNDGVEDNVSGITLSGNSGTNNQWVVTDDQGNILGLPPMPGVVNFDGAGAGVCLIWNLSYEDGLEGLEMGMNANDLTGCFDLSNPITVYRFEDPNCENLCVINGGYLSGDDYIFCVDGEADNVSSVAVSGNTGTNSAWVITDEQGNILGLPPTPEAVNFDAAGPGVCLIWHLSYEDGLEGAEVGANAADLEGCFDLSNSIRVERNQPLGGTLEGGRYEFCVNDGIDDNVSGITLTGNVGGNSQWVVTDAQGNILGLPPMPGVVNFDGAGAGVCLIWHLSYEDGLEGAEVGMNANELEGCYSLSNPITVYRFEDPDCENLCVSNGGYLDSEDYIFCVDGQADNVSGVAVSGNTGTNSAWVITDEQGNILGLPPTPEAVNFDNAGVGVCLIWHLSYEDGLVGLEMGMNANDLEGCYDLSNSVRVVRQAPDGGTVSLIDGSTEYVGTAGDIVFDVTHNTTANYLSYWYIITDDNDNILGFLNSADGNTLDLSVAPPGECHVWGWSYRGLGDPVIGENISTLTDDFCEAISTNFITVTRLEDQCDVEGGMLEGGPFEFTVGDGQADMIPAGSITVANSNGDNFQWIVTDDAGYILGLPPMPGVVNFEGAGPGTCEIWYLRYDGQVGGLAPGLNIADISGDCFDLSNNAVQVIRNGVDDCQANGGELFGGPFEFTVGDGQADMIPAGSITVANSNGDNFQWIVTDDAGYILGLPPMPGVVNFEGAGPGTCEIWYLRYDGQVGGLAPGLNIADISGDCFDLSNNAVQVIRNGVDDCQANGGELFGGPFEFTVGDGQADMIPAGSITVANSNGDNFQWIVTDDAGYILGLPPMPGVVNFEGAGPGTCEIWYLRYDGQVGGLAPGLNIADISGDCFDLSNNAVQVIRNGVDDCQANGGELFGGPFEFTVGDGQADMIPAGSITVANSNGDNFQWIVTDDAGYILGLPPMPGVVNFEGAGPGTCEIWYLRYDGQVGGLAPGLNIADISGDCFDLSNNAVQVIRNGVDDCQANGGELFGGPFEFTVGDGQADMIPAGSITVANSNGDNFQWIVTDDAGYILGLPPMPGVVNFEGAGPGTCEIWYLRYDGQVGGLAPGLNIADISGDCFDLSNNAVQVIRNGVDDCQANGGELFGGPFEFTVGDGQADMIPAGSITVANSNGDNFQWIVTDDAGYILGLPPMPGVVNFEGAGPGTCEIWYLRYDGQVGGLAPGLNIADISGDCFDLSNNAVQVIRNGVDDCQANGGELFGGPFEFTVGDGQADMIPAGSITVANSNGDNFQWIVTDDAGYILGLPPMPGVVNFEGAGPGTCEIWYLRYDGQVGGLAPGLNIADISGDCFDLSNNAVQVIRNDVGNNGVDLELGITVDSDTYDQYEHVTYTITATNNGAEDATNVVISAGLPDGMVYSDHDESAGDYSLFFEEWTLDELAAGESATLELVLFTLVEDVDIVNFVEVVEQDQPDADSAPNNGNGTTPQEDDEAAVTITPANPTPTGGTDADLSLEISVNNDSYDQYENVTYTISLTNDGPDDATGIDIAAGLPDGMVYSDDNVTHGDYNLFFEEWNIDFLASGETAVLELVLFTLVDDADITNFVEVLASDQDDPDSTPGNGNGVTPQEDDEAAITIVFDESFAGGNNNFIQSASSNAPGLETVELYPVPTIDRLTVELNAAEDDLINARVIDITGKVMSVQQFNIVTGHNKLELDVNELPDGMYFLNIKYSNAKVVNERFQKVSR